MDRRIVDLFDRYTHGGMKRRVFLDRLAKIAGSAAAANLLLPLIDYNYARADTVAETDMRIETGTMQVAGVAGLKGYVAKPRAAGRHPAVLVIHENRGLNPHIKDIARRLGAAGYVAMALDCLSPAGGTPDDPDKAAQMIAALKPEDVVAATRAAVAALAGRQDSTGKVGAVGFCWGGGQVNRLAVAEPSLAAGVAYYGEQPGADQVPAIKAALLLHYAGLDQRIDAGIPAFEAALKAAHKTYQLYVYPDTNHGFNNDTSAARYDKKAADLAWGRTLAFFKKYLG
jgi:carboxymethylenebutenolidase